MHLPCYVQCLPDNATHSIVRSRDDASTVQRCLYIHLQLKSLQFSMNTACQPSSWYSTVATFMQRWRFRAASRLQHTVESVSDFRSVAGSARCQRRRHCHEPRCGKVHCTSGCRSLWAEKLQSWQNHLARLHLRQNHARRLGY
ncbi:hypothetical protein NP493_13g03022 [Ridgeia piscesae]|uniref:Uncharacterized protein n=1 Tax=Ridgeia piscesae TaxID=27915 RepID=A0AAD9PF56_RIDPI|nr:hypothetical protein NP493_13g03022 [Ridgeia piscesae]